MNSVLSDLLEISYVPNLGLCLLNDNSDLNLKQILNKIIFTGFTYGNLFPDF